MPDGLLGLQSYWWLDQSRAKFFWLEPKVFLITFASPKQTAPPLRTKTQNYIDMTRYRRYSVFSVIKTYQQIHNQNKTNYVRKKNWNLMAISIWYDSQDAFCPLYVCYTLRVTLGWPKNRNNTEKSSKTVKHSRICTQWAFPG